MRRLINREDKIMKKFTKYIIGGLVVVGLIVLASQTLFKANKNNKLTTTFVQRGNLNRTLTISGKVDAEEKTTLRFQTGGRLAWVGVKEGDYVQKYQGIASLDKRDIEKDLKKKLLAYMNERWDFEQTQDDYSVHGRQLFQVPLTLAEKRILEKAQFDLDSSVVDVEIEALAVEYANLWTPIEGLVTKITSPYAGVNIYLPTQAEFEIINPKSIYFSALVDQADIQDLHEGLAGDLTLDSYDDATISGLINKIAFTPKEGETGTVYEVKFYFTQDNLSYKYKVGMAGDLTMILQSRTNVLYLPTAAIKDDAGKKYINMKKNNKIEKVYIETGLETDDSTEILSGVTENEEVYD